MYDDKEYKDKVRHGGKRGKLLDAFGAVCFECKQQFTESQVVAHHLIDKTDHRFQILLCRSCHRKIHGGEETKPIPVEELSATLESSNSIREAELKLGLSKAGLRYKREKYGLFERECESCKSKFKPTPSLRKYCSDECAEKGKSEKRSKRDLVYAETKKENDRRSYQKHREERIKKVKEYYEQNKEKVLEYHKKLYNQQRGRPL